MGNDPATTALSIASDAPTITKVSSLWERHTLAHRRFARIGTLTFVALTLRSAGEIAKSL